MIEIVTRGWIEVWRGDAFVSRHTVETKAIESAIAHADEAGDGEYELRFPRKTLSRITKTVVPFIWQTQPALSFTQGVAKTVQLRGNYLFDPQQRVRTVVVASGSLPAGCAINGTSVVYDGVGAAATASFTLTASDGTYSQTSSSGSAEIVAVATNSPPVWTVPEGYTLPPFTTAGGTYDLSQHAFDAEGDAMVFARTAGTAPGSVTVSADGVLTVPAGLSADSYTVRIGLATTPDGDWVARTANALWAHKFDEDWEVDLFRHSDGTNDAYSPNTTVQSIYGAGGNGLAYEVKSQGCQWVAGTGTVGAGALQVGPIEISSLTTTSLPASSADTTLTVNSIPYPLATIDPAKKNYVALYDGSKAEVLQITAVAGNTLSVQRAKIPEVAGGSASAYAWPIGAKLYWGVHCGSQWMRPFAPLKYVDGPALGQQDPAWTASKPLYSPVNANGGVRSTGFKFGHYGHPDYGVSSNSETTPPYGAAEQATCMFPLVPGYSFDRKDGSEIYIQLRFKITAPRFYNWNVGDNADQKWLWFTSEGGTYGSGEVIVQSGNDGYVDYYQQSAGVDQRWQYPQAPNGSYSPPFSTNVLQPSYNGDTCTYGADRLTRCFRVPPETWTTFLFRIAPGHRATTRTYATVTGGGGTNWTVSSAAKLPAIIPGTDPITARTQYAVTLRAAGGQTQTATITGISGNTITLASAPTISFASGDLIQMTGAQQIIAVKFDGYPNDTTFALYANREGVDPPDEYVTVSENISRLGWYSDNARPFGWNLFTLGAYSNGTQSFLPWKYVLAEAIASQQFIPCPVPTA